MLRYRTLIISSQISPNMLRYGTFLRYIIQLLTIEVFFLVWTNRLETKMNDRDVKVYDKAERYDEMLESMREVVKVTRDLNVVNVTF